MTTTRQPAITALSLILASSFVACEGADPQESNVSAGEFERTTEALTCGATCNTPNYNATSAAPTCTPLPCGTPACAQKFCGGLLWPDGQIPYRIQMSYTKTINGVPTTFTFSASDVTNIQTAVNDWSSKTQQVVHLFRCDTAGTCGNFYRVLLIRPEDGNSGSTGTRGAGGWVTLAPGSELSTVAHEVGHAIGFDHTFNRAERDRFQKFSESYFCHSQGTPPANPLDGLYTCKGAGPGDKGYDPAFPSIPTHSLGAFDEKSVLNYRSNDICETLTTCDPSGADLATTGDASAAIELYRTGNEWAPFSTLGADVGRCAALDYNLASGVKMVGSPALTSFGFPGLDVFVRGDNGNIYRKYKNVSGGTFLGWSAWGDLGGGTFNSDPAAVSWGPGRIDLFARKADGNLYQSTLNGSTWSAWTSLSKPSVGIGSAPAVASWGPNRLDVFVRGSTDNKLYQRTFSGSPGAWGSWSVVGMSTFSGKPAAVARTTNDIMVATRVGTTLNVRVFNGTWGANTALGATMDSDASPGIAAWSPFRADIFYKFHGMLYQQAFSNAWMSPVPLGGLISSASGSGDPAAVATSSPFKRIDVVAPVNDHGARGVWWKYYPYARPCTMSSGCGGCDPDDPNACHRAADFYGIVANGTWGFAPSEVQNWWSNVAHCNVSATSATAQLCQNASNLYAMATGSFNGAPAEAQTWWTQNSCSATPKCQGLSDLYGMQANVTFGFAPTAVQTWWTGHSCQTIPALPIDNCQRAADEFAMTGGVTFGFAPPGVQTWWTQQSCNAAAHF